MSCQLPACKSEPLASFSVYKAGCRASLERIASVVNIMSNIKAPYAQQATLNNITSVIDYNCFPDVTRELVKPWQHDCPHSPSQPLGLSFPFKLLIYVNSNVLTLPEESVSLLTGIDSCTALFLLEIHAIYSAVSSLTMSTKAVCM